MLVPRDAVTTRFEVLEISGTDHRAVLVGITSQVRASEGARTYA